MVENSRNHVGLKRKGTQILMTMLKRLAILFLAAGWLGAASMPRLVREDGRHQLMVDDKPFLILGIQVGNSSGFPGELEKTWPLAKQLHCNTVEIPISWAAVEPEPGKFDFSIVDGLVEGARKHDLRLILAWFGGFKNGKMDYAPDWVKQDTAKYPRMVDQGGNPIRVLATHVEATMDADARGFAAFMRHLKQIDGDRHTVYMVQVENEPGSLGTDRDHSESANRLFGQQVPAEARQAFGKQNGGTWEEVFGPHSHETFAAYYLARYLNHVAEAGKSEYSLPMFLNVWTDIQDGFYEPGFSHPSGGPTTRMLDLYKVVAPAIDFVSPDIYKGNYVLYQEEAKPYSRPDNPLFIPETGRSPDFCRRMFYALGNLGGIGVSVFGVEGSGGDTALPESLGALEATYRVVSGAATAVMEARKTGGLHSAVEEEGYATDVAEFGDFEVMTQFGRLNYGYGGNRAAGTEETTGRVLIAQLGQNEFILAGFDALVNFRPKFGSELSRADIVLAEEGSYEDGVWKRRRLLSGDQVFFGVRLSGRGMIVKVKVMAY